MPAPDSQSIAPPRRAYKRPFLLTSAWARVAIALGVSLCLWMMTGWAMGWGLS